MTEKPGFFPQLLVFSVLLALCVIVMGAYTRLSDAGLGCPDWPGCYGNLTVPDAVNKEEFQRPLEAGKAWKEMIHRYIAGTLGVLIIIILFMVVKGKTKLEQSVVLPSILVLVVLFQALLGMWTVTLLLSPVIVSAHLMGGLITLSILWWLLLNQRKTSPDPIVAHKDGIKFWAGLGLVLLLAQIFLGGWTSSNYAALSCGTDFPTCAGQWWPAMDFANGFSFIHEAGKNYEFGVLDSPARTAIQKSHRIGALLVFVYMLVLAFKLMKKPAQRLKKLGVVLLLVLVSQVTLGILNVIMALPLSIAVLHNFVAALLLMTVIAVNHRIRWN